MAAPRPKPVVPAKGLKLPQLIDEYAEIRARMNAWKPNVNPHEARFDEIEAEILERQSKHPATKALILQGTRFTLPVSARRKVRSYLAGAVEKLFAKVGQAEFLKVCAPPVTWVDKQIPLPERGQYLSETFTGPRTIGEPVRKQEGNPK
jgi:hypothetical protein